MKQLKFNPNKDMKELEKFGFRYVDVSKVYWASSKDNYWCKKVYLGDDYDNRVFYMFDIKGYYHVDVSECAILDSTTYDLIKANLLIVEGDD